MPRPRIYKDNAARQAAYRRRKAAGIVVTAEKVKLSPAASALVDRVMAADAKASA